MRNFHHGACDGTANRHMVIPLDTALRCVQYQVSVTGALCGEAATIGLWLRVEDDLWELTPVCPRHFREAVEDRYRSDRLVAICDVDTPRWQAVEDRTGRQPTTERYREHVVR